LTLKASAANPHGIIDVWTSKSVNSGSPTLRRYRLFTKILSGDTMPLGMLEFENNLARARVFDAERSKKDIARRLKVEDAMIVT